MCHQFPKPLFSTRLKRNTCWEPNDSRKARHQTLFNGVMGIWLIVKGAFSSCERNFFDRCLAMDYSLRPWECVPWGQSPGFVYAFASPGIRFPICRSDTLRSRTLSFPFQAPKISQATVRSPGWRRVSTRDFRRERMPSCLLCGTIRIVSYRPVCNRGLVDVGSE